jgi:hypothetical protein
MDGHKHTKAERKKWGERDITGDATQNELQWYDTFGCVVTKQEGRIIKGNYVELRSS